MDDFTTIRVPVELGVFDFSTDAEVSFEFPPCVPGHATAIRVLGYLRTGHEGPPRQFTVVLSTISGGGTHFTHIMGSRYPQHAISYNSSVHVLPSGHLRRLFAQCPDTQLNNCHHLQLFITGWLAARAGPPVATVVEAVSAVLRENN